MPTHNNSSNSNNHLNKPEPEEILTEGARVLKSKKLINTKIIGSSNYFARKTRDFSQTITGRIKGIFTGILFILIALIMVWFSENLVQNSAIIKSLPLLTSAEAVNKTGLVKIQEVPIIHEQQSAYNTFEEVLYYEYKELLLKKVDETHTETEIVQENGKDVEKTYEVTEEVTKWVPHSEKSGWAKFSLGDIEIKPETATKYFNYRILKDAKYSKSQKQTKGILEDEEIIVIGNIENQKISGGNIFIISNYSHDELINSIQSSENIKYWILKIGSIILLALGIYMLLGLILLVLDFIPILGDITQAILFILATILATTIVIFFTLIIKFWYIALILLIIPIVFIVLKQTNQK